MLVQYVSFTDYTNEGTRNAREGVASSAGINQFCSLTVNESLPLIRIKVICLENVYKEKKTVKTDLQLHIPYLLQDSGNEVASYYHHLK